MTDTLDLDINNYTIKDLVKFFQLHPNRIYTPSDVELKETEIREKLLKSGQVDKQFKGDLIHFLGKAKEWLIVTICEKPVPPTSLPKNIKLEQHLPVSKSSGGTLSIGSPTFEMEPLLQREKDLQQKPVAQFVHAMTGEYFAGNMNPLVTRTITKCLTVDTRFRDNTNSNTSDITVQLPLKLNKVVSMELSSLEMPFALYNVSSSYGNDYLNIEIEYHILSTNIDVKENRTITIPEGFYDTTTLISKLNSTFLNIQNDVFKRVYVRLNDGYKIILNIDGVGSNYQIRNITINNFKNKNGITDSSPLYTKLAWYLGFTQSVYTGSILYTADSIINISMSRYFYLAIDDFNNSVNNQYITAFNKSIFSPNIIARITMAGDVSKWVMEKTNIVCEPRKYFGPVDIQRLRIQLLDDQGRLLDTSNANYSFCLNFKMLYDL